MKSVAELRATAATKRRMAELARRVGASKSPAADRVMMIQYARELEAEAASLETESATLEQGKAAT